MTTLQSLITARNTPVAKPLIFELPVISPSLDPRAIPIPPEGDAALESASQALAKAQKAGNDRHGARDIPKRNAHAARAARRSQQGEHANFKARPSGNRPRARTFEHRD
jgi:hypothetical protein